MDDDEGTPHVGKTQDGQANPAIKYYFVKTSFL